MSIKILTEVWEHAPVDQGTLLVLLALADSAEERTRTAYPGIQAIAEKARLGERQAQYAIQRLRDLGIVSIQRNASPVKTNLYTIAPVAAWAGARDAKIAPHGKSAETQSVEARDAVECVSETQWSAPKPSVTVRDIEPSDSARDLFDAEKATSKQADHFDEAWSLYPERIGANPKKAARAKFAAAVKKIGWPALKAALEAYARQRQGEDPRYTPMMSTWLNQERWEGLAPAASTKLRMNPADPMEGIPEHIAKIIRLEIDPDLRDQDARAWWARQEATE